VKIRNGFVSNSSSSSFMVPKVSITGEQYEQILNHIEEGKRLGMDDKFDNWEISYRDEWRFIETENVLKGYTSMDNFNMQDFMQLIGVDKIEAHFEGDNC